MTCYKGLACIVSWSACEAENKMWTIYIALLFTKANNFMLCFMAATHLADYRLTDSKNCQVHPRWIALYCAVNMWWETRNFHDCASGLLQNSQATNVSGQNHDVQGLKCFCCYETITQQIWKFLKHDSCATVQKQHCTTIQQCLLLCSRTWSLWWCVQILYL